MSEKPKRPNLRWKGAVGYYDHGGEPRRWERLGTDEAVVLARWERIHRLHAPEHGTCDKMVADYLEHANVKASTLVNYRRYRMHLAAAFGAREPHTITQGDVVRYLRECPRKTARGEIGVLSMAFAAWMEEERLDFNPCFGVRVKGLPTSKRDRLILPDELERTIAATDERMAVFIEMGYALGLRHADLRGLRWTDFGNSVQTAKTGQRQRFERNPALDALLDRCRALQARVASPFVFCNSRGQPWSYSALQKRWVKACKRAGVVDAHFHDLRAVGATELEETVSRKAAQEYLGHRNPATTERYLRGRKANVVTPLSRKKA